MPSYELAMILRTMPRTELITALKRTAESIFEKGGFIRNIYNQGHRDLPYKISEHGLVHKTGTSFVLKFDIPPKELQDLNEELGRDVDVVRKEIFKSEKLPPIKCTLQDELQPPAYREEVIKMMRIAKKGQKEKYPHNTGLNYYPFQK